MSICIEFRQKSVNSLKLQIKHNANITEIFSTLNQLHFQGIDISSHNIVYSILELVNNSIRAMQEKKIAKPVEIRIFISGKDKSQKLVIDIIDFAGGFDVKGLPYDFSAHSESIDIHGTNFLEYRQKHKNKRFGMGLYIAKTTFSHVDVRFIDNSRNLIEWKNGATAGTHIRLVLMEKI